MQVNRRPRFVVVRRVAVALAALCSLLGSAPAAADEVCASITWDASAGVCIPVI